jgi:hypothetical protein
MSSTSWRRVFESLGLHSGGSSGRRLGPNERRGGALSERRSGTRQAARPRSGLEVVLRLGYPARDIEHREGDPRRSSCIIDAWIHRVEASAVWQRRGKNRCTRALSDSCRALTQFDQYLGDATFGQSRHRNSSGKTRVAFFGFGESGLGIARLIGSIMREACQRAD